MGDREISFGVFEAKGPSDMGLRVCTASETPASFNPGWLLSYACLHRTYFHVEREVW